MNVRKGWRAGATNKASAARKYLTVAADRLRGAVRQHLSVAANATSDAYNATLSWKDNSELSHWLTDHLSKQVTTAGSEAMDAVFNRTHIGGNWHRLYDGGHTLAGSWTAIRDTFSHASALDQLGVWANEYWKDFITTRGMPIIALDHAATVSDYFKHLDCVNVAQTVGGDLTGFAIWCNWNDPEKLVASATASDCSGLVYANVVAPLVSLIGLGRAYVLLKRSEQNQLRDLLAPALKGLTRSGASILLITIIPGGFLVHLSSGIVVSVAHSYAWEKAWENKDEIFTVIKERLSRLVTDAQAYKAGLPNTA